MRMILILGAASLALASCSSGDADKDGDGKISGDEAKAEMASGGKMSMDPGQYEVKISFSEINAPGLPAAAQDMMKKQLGSGTTIKTCMTKEQVENPGADFFGQQEDSGCKFDKLDRSGNQMKVAMTCEPRAGMKMVSNMNGTFGTNSYSMTVDQKMTGMPTGEMSMKGKIEGKRVGDCPA